MIDKKNTPIDNLEVWAGIECTVNRIGDQYLNQMQLNGHYIRDEDIEVFASLGIKKIRYPVLWELVAPNGIEKADWSWVDRRITLLQKHKIEPIIGFCHHGSGPLHTSLVKPCFVEGLVEFASEFIKRYPHIKYFTPVNEPLTTARFSTLYGHWYPHTRCDKMFGKALLHQCRSIIECIRAIREVNPQAMLIQTEDMGRTFSTPLLKYQADYENERRWLSLDLITGRLCPGMPMWDYLLYIGVDKNELQWFIENPCQPEIIGINHYPTSERYLDEKYHDYPDHTHGGNSKHLYADVEMVRVSPQRAQQTMYGHYGLLKETWERYKIPLAITEVHISGGREDQLRWLNNAWKTGLELKEEGVDLRAITAWSLLGSYNWANLVTKDIGLYESGVFDVRSGKPRPTALAKLLTCLAKGETYSNPLLNHPGWWQRDDRVLYPYSINTVFDKGNPAETKPSEIADGRTGKSLFNSILTKVDDNDRINNQNPPVLLIGTVNALRTAFEKVCDSRRIPYKILNSNDIDISNKKVLKEIINETSPWSIIYTAGFVNTKEVETLKKETRANKLSEPGYLARLCYRKGIPFISFSSDMVFDGTKQKPYIESDKINPLNEFGRSKAEEEKLILKEHPDALIIRTGNLFNPWNELNFITEALSMISNNIPYTVPNHSRFSPTYAPDLANVVIDLLIDQEKGIWHLSNSGDTTCEEIVRKITGILGLNSNYIYSPYTDNFNASRAQMPHYIVLGSERGVLMPSLDDAIKRYCVDIDLNFITYTNSKLG